MITTNQPHYNMHSQMHSRYISSISQRQNTELRMYKAWMQTALSSGIFESEHISPAVLSFLSQVCNAYFALRKQEDEMQQCERKVMKRSEAEDFRRFSCCNSRHKRSRIPTRNPFNLFLISDKDLHSFGFFSNSTPDAIFQLDRQLWPKKVFPIICIHCCLPLT